MSLSAISGALSRLRTRLPPHRAFAVFAPLVLLAVLFATPPFMNPDETQHFRRAYGVSQGDLIAPVRNGQPGVEQPLSLTELNDSFFYPNRAPPMPLADTFSEFRRPLDPLRIGFLPLRADAIYSPVVYAPQAIGIAAGRMFGAGPLALFYLARLGSALACLALFTGVLRTMRLGREAGLLIAGLPMSLAMMTSCSPDGLTLGGGLLFAALLGRCLEDGRWSAGRLAMIGLSGALMCAAKVVYLPALGAAAVCLASPAPWPQRLRVAGVLSLMILAIALAAVGWLKLVGPSHVEAREGVDAASQFQHVLADPLGFVAILLRSLAEGAPFLVRTTLGVLGWTDVFLPNWAYGVLVLAVPLSLLASGDPPPRLSPLVYLWIALLLGLVLLLIELGLYMVWTPVGGPLIEGVQGRYFLPVLPLAGVMLTALVARLRRFADPDACYAGLLGALVLSTAAMGLTLSRHFGLFHG